MSNEIVIAIVVVAWISVMSSNNRFSQWSDSIIDRISHWF